MSTALDELDEWRVLSGSVGVADADVDAPPASLTGAGGKDEERSTAPPPGLAPGIGDDVLSPDRAGGLGPDGF